MLLIYLKVFKIILIKYFNNLMTAEMRTKATDENRTIMTFYVTDTDNSLTANQINNIALISRK